MATEVPGANVVITEPLVPALVRTRKGSPSVLATFAKPTSLGPDGAAGADAAGAAGAAGAAFVVFAWLEFELEFDAGEPAEALVDGDEPSLPVRKSEIIQPLLPAISTLNHTLPLLSLSLSIT